MVKDVYNAKRGKNKQYPPILSKFNFVVMFSGNGQNTEYRI